MKYLYTTLIGLLCMTYLFAMPAYPLRVPVDVEGKTVYIRIFGDERAKHAETMDGYTVIQDTTNTWFYATKNAEGFLEPSAFKLVAEKNVECERFLQLTPRHLKAEKNVQKPLLAAPLHHGKVIGNRRMLIILMEYKDLAFTKNKDDFYRLFNQEGYKDEGAQGSVRDFYLSASYGQLTIEADIYGPYITSKAMASYGRNGMDGSDSNPYALFEEAIVNVAQEVDLHVYDSNKDGIVDNVHIIFAGYGEEGGAAADAIWSHEMTFSKPYRVQDLKVDRYSCAPELRGNRGGGISRIGPHCHEIGHALGAMDYYDTDYENGGGFSGMGVWDVMASGSWNNEGITPADFNAYVKTFDYGWISPRPLPQGEVAINPSNADSESYYILQSPNQGDFYLFENRQRTEWGRALPGAGLLICHVHQNLADAGNKINATAPQMCYPVCASSQADVPGKTPSTYGDINSSGCLFPGTSGNHSFGKTSVPRAFFWTGADCDIDISNIDLLPDGTVTLYNNSIGMEEAPHYLVTRFKEDFEEDNEQLVQVDWWEVTESDDNGFSVKSSPVAHGGTHFLQLSAQNEYFDSREGSFELICESLFGNGKILLCGYITSSGLRGKTNHLRIGYKTSPQGDWIYSAIESGKDLSWEKFSIELPGSVLSHFRFEGTAVPRSILAIDDIEILQEEPTDASESSLTPIERKIPEGNSLKYYSADGCLRKGLARGLILVKLPDGSIRKYYY